MAGTTQGITPNSAPTSDFSGRSLIHAPASSRTRLVHGAWALGNLVCAVHSSRREADGRNVIVTFSDGALQLAGHMPPGTARAMAVALIAAAAQLDARTAA